MDVSATALDADIGGLSAGETEFAVSAYGRGGTLAYYGQTSWDPSQAVTVNVALGRVGRIRLEAGFPESALD